MKKLFCLLLVAMLIFTTACGASPSPSDTGEVSTPTPNSSTPTPGDTTPTPDDPTPTPEPPKEVIDVSYLADYTIVYPSAYTEYQMYEIYLLRDVIEHITGTTPNVIADTDDAVDNEIIIGSSARETDVDSDIAAFSHGFDYLIARVDDKIVLGGNNFYADMRAIYDFINNYLGYDDIEDIYGDPTVKAEGVNINVYKEPVMKILGSNYTVSPFTEQFVFRDAAEAHFNLLMISINISPDYTYEETRDALKWASRYSIMLIPGWNAGYEELYAECPAVWGHYLQDEPPVNDEDFAACAEKVKNYLEVADKYGWKPFVNFVGIFNPTNDLYEKYFKDILPVFSFDSYMLAGTRRDSYVLAEFEGGRLNSRAFGEEYWTFIEAYNLVNRGFNTSKLFRWESYIAMCFGTQCIEYFQYGDASPNYTAEGNWRKGSLINYDFTKNQAWYDAKRANEDILEFAEKFYNNYDNVGAFVLGQKFDDTITELNFPYDASDVFEDFINDGVYNSPYLVGCFEKLDGNGKMFMVVNMSALDTNDYDSSFGIPIRLKLNGSNIKFYRDSEEIQVTEKDGYYYLEIPTGFCITITMD